jgi:hypothetical protein
MQVLFFNGIKTQSAGYIAIVVYSHIASNVISFNGLGK